ncbi:hypothetical protein NE237_017770 [Protea cynaroides]|uniref:Uncharacterized protein n=1 Tax=Protea cynaroides TaxID=273540 RepID=A0A9Q0K8M0_9MAGN|nr:hypothetical protein NE237_017770 [Protea cynaroides]
MDCRWWDRRCRSAALFTKGEMKLGSCRGVLAQFKLKSIIRGSNVRIEAGGEGSNKSVGNDRKVLVEIMIQASSFEDVGGILASGQEHKQLDDAWAMVEDRSGYEMSLSHVSAMVPMADLQQHVQVETQIRSTTAKGGVFSSSLWLERETSRVEGMELMRGSRCSFCPVMSAISHVTSDEEAAMSNVLGLAEEEGSSPLLSHVAVWRESTMSMQGVNLAVRENETLPLLLHVGIGFSKGSNNQDFLREA